MPTMHSSSPPAAAPGASSKEAAATVAATATATPTHHDEDEAFAAVHESTLQRLTHDPLRHAAHPEGPCLSLDCLRAHCQWLASVDPAAAGQPSTDSSPSTSPFSGSPRSTRSGTSPGYANDWALRPEPLAVRSDKPSRTRRDRAVHQLASAKLADSNATTATALAAASTTGATAAICATTDEAFAAAASSSSSSFTSCSLAATAASSSSVVSSQSAFSSQLNVGVVPPAASPSELGPSSSSSAAAAPAAPIPAGDPILQPTVGGLSKLLQRRQQRKQQDGHAT